MAAKKVTMKQIVDLIEYPYSINLSLAFLIYLETTKLSYKNIGSTIILQFDNKTQLNSCLKVLNKSNDGAATIILDGIKRSLNL
jgi:hypothetical protein